MVNVALVGVSGFGRIHYQDLLRACETGRANALAATVINQDEEPEKCARLREMGCRLFDDFSEMLDTMRGQIDLCMIPTGIHLHAPMTIAALEAGANVFVEKPAAATVQDVLAMREAEQRAGRFVAVGFQHRYDPMAHVLQRVVLRGKLGRPRVVKCKALWPRDTAYFSRNNWAGTLRRGDDWVLDTLFNNALAHDVLAMCFLASDHPARAAHPVQLAAELYRVNRIESPDTACIRATLDSEVQLYFWGTHACEANRNVGPEMELQCESGSICWSHRGALIQHKGGDSEELSALQGNTLRDAMIDAVLQRVQGHAAFLCTLDMALSQTLCANAAFESCPVIPVFQDVVDEVPTANGASRVVIRGIDALIEECYATESMFSETGAAWALPGSSLQVSGYSQFPSLNGGRLPRGPRR